VVVLGFLKFLKRDKKKEAFDELDLPPAPPHLEGFEEKIDLPEFPDFEEKEISETEEMPKFDFPEKEEEIPELSEESIPDFPTFPDVKEEQLPSIPPISAPSEIPEPMPELETPFPSTLTPPPVQEQKEESSVEEGIPKAEFPEPHLKMGRGLFRHEKKVFFEGPSGKSIYVKVDNFKAMLGSINMVRSDLKKSEGALTKLESIKNSKDKSFDKVKSSLEDLQKKLIFIDKTLFKGE